jgi:hypothetical protein
MNRRISRRISIPRLLAGMLLTALLLGCSFSEILQGPKALEVTHVTEVTKVLEVTRIIEVTKLITPTRTRVVTPISGIQEGIYFTQGQDLYRMNLNGGRITRLASGVGPSERMVFDPARKNLYITRWDAGEQILQVDLNQPTQSTILTDGLDGGGQGVAVDAKTSKIYLGLYYSGVFSKGIDTAGAWQQLVSPADLAPLLGQRGQLQIDLENRDLYFRTAYNSDCDACRYIWRLGLDGQNLEKVLPANGGDALALDTINGKLYFSDIPGNGTIWSAKLDGSALKTIQTLPSPYTFCRSVFVDAAYHKLYYLMHTENNEHVGMAIARSNTDGTEFEILHETAASFLDVIGDILVIHGE